MKRHAAAGRLHPPEGGRWRGVPWEAMAVLALLAGGALWAWWRSPAALPMADPPAVAQAASGVVAAAEAAPPVPREPAIAHPIPEGAADAAAPLPGLTAALEALFGRQALMVLFQLDGFAERVVATVDQLGREHAAPQRWPLVPAPGRFAVVPGERGAVVDPANARRYDAHLGLLDQVPVSRVVALYLQHYPRFQQAYEELGYPGAYFNDRLVQVIDLLLATPQPAQPPTLHLPAVQGPVAPPRPWVMHTFDDPALQALPAGQRLLLRLNAAQRARVTAWLQAVRRAVTEVQASDSTLSR